MNENGNVADKLREAVKKAFEEGKTASDFAELVVLPTKQVLALVEENDYLREENEYLDMCGRQFLADYQNAQVQLDELTKERDKQRKLYVKEFAEHANHLGEFEKIKQQAVKDTAKEILQELYDQIDENTPKWVEVQIKIIAKRKGVEVE